MTNTVFHGTEPYQVCFIHAIFCHVGLPRSPVNRPWFSRRSGAAWISLLAGEVSSGSLTQDRGLAGQSLLEAATDDNGSGVAGGNLLPPAALSSPHLPSPPIFNSRFSIPYGVLPRLLLVWLSTEALRSGRTDICLGATLSERLRHFGMHPDGRRYFALQRQLCFLAQTRLVMGFRRVEFDGHILSPFSSSITSGGKEQGTRKAFPDFRYVHLSSSYVRTLNSHAVPLRWDAVWHLRGSSLALDLYFWLSSRLCRLERDGLFLSWEQLHAQFGHEYRGRDGVRLFRREVTRRLPHICRVYPTACIRCTSEGIVLLPSPSPVLPRT